MLLSWQAAAAIAAALVAITAAARASHRPRAIAAAAFTAETAVVLGLYAMWQWAGDLGMRDGAAANRHGIWLWNLEQDLRWPSELSVERLVLPHRLLSQALNLFYLGVHVPALIIFLVWLFVRHRSSYGKWRTTGALLTGFCLAIQFIPVAPPRLLPQLGFVDLAAKYGQSVYNDGGVGAATQVAAMPSIHVAWAAFIALAVICVSTSRWRWLVLAHPILTTIVVVATANHWWIDGVVGVALIPVAYGVGVAGTAIVATLRGQRSMARPAPGLDLPGPPEPVGEAWTSRGLTSGD